MAFGLTSSQARTTSISDLVIYNEIDTITRAIYAASLAGEFKTSVDNGTTMTESTPIVTVVGTEADPVTGGAGEALELAGETVSLLADSDLDQIIAAINDTGISGLTASKDATNHLVLTYETPQNNWGFAIGNDSGNATVGIDAGTVDADAPESVSYYSVWSGQSDDRKQAYEFSQVVKHFQDLGYNILAKQNTNSNTTTYKWEIYW